MPTAAGPPGQRACLGGSVGRTRDLEAETSAHTRRALMGDLRNFLGWLIARYPEATGLPPPLSVHLRNEPARVLALFRGYRSLTLPKLSVTVCVVLG